MIRLACSPESHLHSVILSLKSHLAISSSSSSPFHHFADDLVDESFLNDVDQSSPEFPPKSRRSYSVSDVLALGHLEGEEAAGLTAWKQCMYFTKGFCKNGAACRFLHHDLDGVNAAVGVMDQRHQLFRSKSFSPRLATAAAAAAVVSQRSATYLPAKCMNFMLQNQLADSPRSVFMGDDLLDLGQTGFERSHFHMNGAVDMMNPGSRQIYLTFPAGSSFKEEDVSNYFSIYGPVQDVRIPYQQKRMFGFVTFVYPETVQIILAKGNPHFVCDARVLVKPYKEKGKVPDRYRNMQTLNRGEHFICDSPTGLGLRDPFDNQAIGPGMLSNQDILWRRKLEEADIQQALERQSQRLMGMQLLDANRQHHQRAFSMGGMAVPSPIHAGSYLNRSLASSSASSSPESTDGNFYTPLNGTPPTYDPEMHSFNQLSVGANKEGMQNRNFGNMVVSGNDASALAKNGDLQESVNPDHFLPESPFASSGEVAVPISAETETSNEIEKITIPSASIPAAFSVSKNLTGSPFNPAASTLEMAKSCYLQLPRLSASHGAIEM